MGNQPKGFADGEVESRVDAVGQRFRLAGRRMTGPRREILAVLLRAGDVLKADEIRERMALPSGGLVTVYRNLDALVELGVVERLHAENGTQLFLAEMPAPGSTAQGGHDHHHHHVICRRCRRTACLDVPLEAACRAAEAEAERLGFSDVGHSFEVHGLCRACREEV